MNKIIFVELEFSDSQPYRAFYFSNENEAEKFCKEVLIATNVVSSKLVINTCYTHKFTKDMKHE
jgi:hypothetical protein